jgi:hypothetical protein
MGFKVRKQYPEFELDEYTPEVDLSFEEAIREIRVYDWDVENKKSRDLVEEHASPSICLRNNDELVICKEEEGKFSFGYRPKAIIPKSYLVVVPNLEILIELLKIFHSNDKLLFVKKFKVFQFLKSSVLLDFIGLFNTRKKNRISQNVEKKEFLFRVNSKKVFYMLGWCLALFLMPAVLWVFVGKKPFEWTPFLVMQALMTALTLPGFVTAYNHWEKNGSWTLLFQSRENKFILITPDGKEIHNKKDFTKRIRTEVKSNAPWNSFEYTTLIKVDGSQLHFSSILISNLEISRFFASLEESTESKAIPIIKNKILK